MSNRRLAGVVAAAALTLVPAAAAKDFGPGDLRVCGRGRCAAITDKEVLPLLGAFYYSGPQPKAVSRPRLRSPSFELRFRNGYVTGIAAGADADRFLSYGVYLERFRRGTWYRVPAPLAQELRALTARLESFRLTRTALARSR